MSFKTEDTEYEKPQDLRKVEITPSPADSQIYTDAKPFWMSRRRHSKFVRIGFPEPHGFIARMIPLDELIDAVDELSEFEDEE